MPELDVLARGIAIGVASSALMDLWSAVLRRRFEVPTLHYRLLGRWIGHMPKGRLFHERIAASEPVPFERRSAGRRTTRSASPSRCRCS